MNESKRKKLEAAGFKSGTVAEFLGLTPDESAIVETRVVLGRLIREACATADVSQSVFATLAGVTQARISQIESADEAVSIDLMLRTALKAGIPLKRIGKELAAV